MPVARVKPISSRWVAEAGAVMADGEGSGGRAGRRDEPLDIGDGEARRGHQHQVLLEELADGHVIGRIDPRFARQMGMDGQRPCGGEQEGCVVGGPLGEFREGQGAGGAIAVDDDRPVAERRRHGLGEVAGHGIRVGAGRKRHDEAELGQIARERYAGSRQDQGGAHHQAPRHFFGLHHASHQNHIGNRGLTPVKSTSSLAQTVF